MGDEAAMCDAATTCENKNESLFAKAMNARYLACTDSLCNNPNSDCYGKCGANDNSSDNSGLLGLLVLCCCCFLACAVICCVIMCVVIICLVIDAIICCVFNTILAIVIIIVVA